MLSINKRSNPAAPNHKEPVMASIREIRDHVENEITDKGTFTAAENIAAAFSELTRSVELGNTQPTIEAMMATFHAALEHEAFGGF